MNDYLGEVLNESVVPDSIALEDYYWFNCAELLQMFAGI